MCQTAMDFDSLNYKYVNQKWVSQLLIYNLLKFNEKILSTQHLICIFVILHTQNCV